MQFSLRLACAAAILLASLFVTPAFAARVAVLSNRNFDFVVSDFTAHVSGHHFTAIDVSNGPPDLATLLASYDEILLFEDRLFENAPAVGDRVFQFAESGRPVILATFYDQDRSDRSGQALGQAHGWGMLESIDPNTTDTFGAQPIAKTLNPASIVAHPLTAGVSSLYSNVIGGIGYAGGNEAKPGTLVLATWTQTNANNRPDPAIALRSSASSCVMQIGMAPVLPLNGTLGTDFGGDYYQVWKNAFDYGAGNCGRGWVVPTLSPAPATALAALLAMFAALALRRRARASTRR
ncbi:MAG: hypothetical protein ABI440_13795 [Casimicrobiaceae bacterium]